MGKKRRLSADLEELLAASTHRPNRTEISSELAELLAAYGKPPKMPSYDGDPADYAAAVNIFQRLSESAEAVSRREAMDRYFARKHAHDDQPRDGQGS